MKTTLTRTALAVPIVALVVGVQIAEGSYAQADIFTICPDGHEGVVGDHTSCGFAANIRNGFFRFGTQFNAYSPATNQWYPVTCDPTRHPAYFASGEVINSIDCYASTNAEVVIW